MKKLIISTLFSLAFFPFLLVQQASAAASFFLTPSSGTYSQGSSFKVQVGINTGGDSVNAVQAYISYPSDKLQATNINTGGSPLTIVAEKTAGGGMVKIGGGTPTPGFSGNKVLATITFKVLADSGTASLSFTDETMALKDSDNSNIAGGKSGASYSLTPKSSGKPPKATATPLSQAQESFRISNMKVTEITKKSARITWNTSAPANSRVEFGPQLPYSYNLTSAEYVTSHSMVITEEYLIPGTKYNFRVVSTDEQGTEISSPNSTFKTKGYRIRVLIKDLLGKPLKGVKVMLFSEPMETVTDEEGYAVFDEVPPGKHEVVVNGEGKKAQPIEVALSEGEQEFNISHTPSFRGISIGNIKFWIYLAVLVVTLLLMIILIFALVSRNKKGKLYNNPDQVLNIDADSDSQSF